MRFIVEILSPDKIFTEQEIKNYICRGMLASGILVRMLPVKVELERKKPLTGVFDRGAKLVAQKLDLKILEAFDLTVRPNKNKMTMKQLLTAKKKLDREAKKSLHMKKKL